MGAAVAVQALCLAAGNTLAGFVVLPPWTGWGIARVPFQVSFQGVGTAVCLDVFVTVGGLFLWLGLLRVVPARVAASVQYLQLIFGIAAASVLRGDPLGLAFALGSLLVRVGLAITMSPR